MLTHINDERPDLTIAERIDEYHGTQQLLKFPAGSETHAEASKNLEWMRPALVVSMVAEGINYARTKVATASLDEYGTLTVEKYEVAL